MAAATTGKSDSTPESDATSSAAEKSMWWRIVLGEYPTGVCLVAARETNGAVTAMVVGSFVAISRNPPLVGFFVDTSSRTFARIESAGRIGISVLGSTHDALSRLVASKAPDALDHADFADSASTATVLTDAVVWFDVTVECSQVFGDHRLVVANVNDFGVGTANAGLPLLFRRAGYGTFAAPGEAFDSRAFIDRLDWSALADYALHDLVAATGVAVTVTTQLGDSVVILRTISPDSAPGSEEHAGFSYPFAAPIAPIFVAWAPEARRHGWVEASRHLVGSIDRDLIARQLEGVRERGYGVAGDHATATRLSDLVTEPDAARESLAQMWNDIATSGKQIDSADLDWRSVSGVQVPVFDAHGEVVLGLSLLGIGPFTSAAQLDDVAALAKQAADELADRIATHLSGEVVRDPQASDRT